MKQFLRFSNIPLWALLSCLCFSCYEFEKPQEAFYLEYSNDTLLFDTLFTEQGSITKRLKIYNVSDQDFLIPSIGVFGGAASSYEIIVNGISSHIHEDILLRSNDSLLLLAKVFIDPTDENLPFIVHDSIEVVLKNKREYIDLISWGQNAHFLSDSILNCDQIWVNDKPYVIYDNILISEGCKLEIEPGVRIYSHFNSSIYVAGQIQVNGSSTEPVVFTNDRLDKNYENLPGQWNGIYILEGSTNNLFEFVNIRNSIYGLRIGNPDEDSEFDTFLKQVKIENCSDYGILAFTSDVHLQNTLILNSGISAFGGYAGGHYYIENSNFINHNLGYIRREVLFEFSDNIVLADQSILSSDLELTLINSIIWGPMFEEINFSLSGNTNSQYLFSHSLLKSSDSQWNSNNNILNFNPQFSDIQKFNFNPDINSPLVDAGIDLGLQIDLLGNIRNGIPDIGALEHQ